MASISYMVLDLPPGFGTVGHGGILVDTSVNSWEIHGGPGERFNFLSEFMGSFLFDVPLTIKAFSGGEDAYRPGEPIEFKNIERYQAIVSGISDSLANSIASEAYYYAEAVFDQTSYGVFDENSNTAAQFMAVYVAAKALSLGLEVNQFVLDLAGVYQPGLFSLAELTLLLPSHLQPWAAMLILIDDLPDKALELSRGGGGAAFALQAGQADPPFLLRAAVFARDLVDASLQGFA